MPVDYSDSAKRHWEDATYLLAETRIANADHLFGLSAECSLKAIMIMLGMKLNRDKPEKPYAVHINKLWDEFITFAHRENGAHYAARISGIPNPFDGWDINQRYDHRSVITPDIAERHHQAARWVKQLLDDAILNEDQP